MYWVIILVLYSVFSRWHFGGPFFSDVRHWEVANWFQVDFQKNALITVIVRHQTLLNWHQKKGHQTITTIGKFGTAIGRDRETGTGQSSHGAILISSRWLLSINLVMGICCTVQTLITSSHQSCRSVNPPEHTTSTNSSKLHGIKPCSTPPDTNVACQSTHTATAPRTCPAKRYTSNQPWYPSASVFNARITIPPTARNTILTFYHMTKVKTLSNTHTRDAHGRSTGFHQL